MGQATIAWERDSFVADARRSGWTDAAAELAWWIFARGRRLEELTIRDGSYAEITAETAIASKSGVVRARAELADRGVLVAKTIYRGGKADSTRWRLDVGTVNALLADDHTAEERCGTTRNDTERCGTVRNAGTLERSGNQRSASFREISVPQASSLLPEPDPPRTIKTRSTRTRTPEPDPSNQHGFQPPGRRARPGRNPNPFVPGGRPIGRGELGDPQQLEVLYAFAVAAGRVPECDWGRLCVYAAAAHAVRVGEKPERLFGANVAGQVWNFTGGDEDQANRWIREIDGVGSTSYAGTACAT